MIILHDPDTLLHETVELLGAKIRPALESPARIQAIVKSLETSQQTLQTTEISSDERLTRLLDLIRLTHASDYVEHLQNAHKEWLSAQLITPSDSVLPECFVFSTAARLTPKRPADIYARAGYYAIDMSSGIMDKTFQSVIASANLALEATDLVRAGGSPPQTALALCRPPGHHCDGRRAGGYCYVNNAALAVSAWREHCPKATIGILDIDFHHGNGTQEIFYDDADVYYASIHGEDEFPYYTGAADERGGKHAPGTNLNLPLKTGSSFEQYVAKLEVATKTLADANIGLLLVSLGFDTFYLDPLGNFQIETEHYGAIARKIRHTLSTMPAVILFEGGYVLEHLGGNMIAFVQGWESPGI